MNYSRILIRATNWVGDAVMCLPALRALRDRFPQAHLTILAKPFVADLYAGQPFADEIVLYTPGTLKDKIGFGLSLRASRFDFAILLHNAFEAAFVSRFAGIPHRIGYDRDALGRLLTKAIPSPRAGEIPPHQRFYYLEMLRRAVILDRLPESDAIHLGRPVSPKISGPLIGISPGAAYGSAKRWLPQRFAEASSQIARARNASIAIFGTKEERALCEQVAGLLTGMPVTNYAGRTTLAQFIELASACEVFLTNDSGSMHIASALGIPTVAIFGATDHVATGPTGPHSRVIREPVECSPCLLRECPIDHRCMTAVSASRVAEQALRLLTPSGQEFRG